MGARLILTPLILKPLTLKPLSLKLWSVEQTLHFALAAIVVVGWALIYTTLMRGMHPPDIASNDRAGTAVSTNVAPRPTPSLPATPAMLRE